MVIEYKHLFSQAISPKSACFTLSGRLELHSLSNGFILTAQNWQAFHLLVSLEMQAFAMVEIARTEPSLRNIW